VTVYVSRTIFMGDLESGTQYRAITNVSIYEYLRIVQCIADRVLIYS